MGLCSVSLTRTSFQPAVQGKDGEFQDYSTSAHTASFKHFCESASEARLVNYVSINCISGQLHFIYCLFLASPCCI